MEASAGIRFVAADHPSLDADVDAFLDRLQLEQRWFGPSARSRPGPFHSSTESLRAGGGFRLAAIECGRIVGLARVDGAGELFLAVGAEHRERGIGTALGHAMVTRARELHYPRLVLRTTRRSRAARCIAGRLGAAAHGLGRGRVEFVLELVGGERTA